MKSYDVLKTQKKVNAKPCQTPYTINFTLKGNDKKKRPK